MLFITVKSASAEQVPKVLQVVEETKRIRHKAGCHDLDVLLDVVSHLLQGWVEKRRCISMWCTTLLTNRRVLSVSSWMTARLQRTNIPLRIP